MEPTKVVKKNNRTATFHLIQCQNCNEYTYKPKKTQKFCSPECSREYAKKNKVGFYA